MVSKAGLIPRPSLQELARRAVSERLVQALVVVEFEVGGDAVARLRHVVVGLEVDFFVLEAAPQPFHEEVSGGGESHPSALAEPYLSLSAHTAPIIQPCPASSVQ